MLERHAAASAAVRSAERALLAEQLAALEAALEPGLARLNWASLTVPDFVATVNKVGGGSTWLHVLPQFALAGRVLRAKHAAGTAGRHAAACIKPPELLFSIIPPLGHMQAVDQFNALVAQVQKNTAQIEKTIHHISRARLLPPDAPIPSAHADSNTVAGAAASAASEASAAGMQQPRRDRPSSAGGATATQASARADPGAHASDAPAGPEGKPGPAAGDAVAASADAVQAEGAAAPPAIPDLQEFYEDWEQHRQQVRS